jgi:hypothetical protein
MNWSLFIFMYGEYISNWLVWSSYFLIWIFVSLPIRIMLDNMKNEK